MRAGAGHAGARLTDDVERASAGYASPAVALRPVTDADEPFLREVYASSRADELSVVPWSDEQRAAFLDMQYRAQTTDYHRRFPEGEPVMQVSRAGGGLPVGGEEKEFPELPVGLDELSPGKVRIRQHPPAFRRPGRFRELPDQLGERLLRGGRGRAVGVRQRALGLPLEHDDYMKSWQKTLDVDLVGELRMIRACLPYLLRNGDGRIVNVASTEGLGATKFNSAYVAAKTGVVGVLATLGGQTGLNLAVEAAGQGVFDRHGAQLIGTGLESIRMAEDRELLKQMLRRIGEPIPATKGILLRKDEYAYLELFDARGAG